MENLEKKYFVLAKQLVKDNNVHQVSVEKMVNNAFSHYVMHSVDVKQARIAVNVQSAIFDIAKLSEELIRQGKLAIDSIDYLNNKEGIVETIINLFPTSSKETHDELYDSIVKGRTVAINDSLIKADKELKHILLLVHELGQVVSDIGLWFDKHSIEIIVKLALTTGGNQYTMFKYTIPAKDVSLLVEEICKLK